MGSLTTLLGHRHHGVVADEAGHEGQGAGPQVLDDGRHEGPSQGLLEGAARGRVLGLVAVRDDHGGDQLLCKAAHTYTGDQARELPPKRCIIRQLYTYCTLRLGGVRGLIRLDFVSTHRLTN